MIPSVKEIKSHISFKSKSSPLYFWFYGACLCVLLHLGYLEIIQPEGYEGSRLSRRAVFLLFIGPPALIYSFFRDVHLHSKNTIGKK